MLRKRAVGLLTGPATEVASLPEIRESLRKRDWGEVFANSTAGSLDILLSCAGISFAELFATLLVAGNVALLCGNLSLLRILYDA